MLFGGVPHAGGSRSTEAGGRLVDRSSNLGFIMGNISTTQLSAVCIKLLFCSKLLCATHTAANFTLEH